STHYTYTLSLHDALPISTQYVAPAYGAQPAPGYMPPQQPGRSRRGLWIALAIIGGLIVLSCAVCGVLFVTGVGFFAKTVVGPAIDRKSTRLNSSHGSISY